MVLNYRFELFLTPSRPSPCLNTPPSKPSPVCLYPLPQPSPTGEKAGSILQDYREQTYYNILQERRSLQWRNHFPLGEIRKGVCEMVKEESDMDNLSLRNQSIPAPFLWLIVILKSNIRYSVNQNQIHMKRYFALLIVSALLMTQFSSCKKDKGDPPVLPPAGSMAIDFNNFDQTGKGDYSVSIPKSTPNSNWELASGAAMLWNVIIYTTLLRYPFTHFSWQQTNNQSILTIIPGSGAPPQPC